MQIQLLCQALEIEGLTAQVVTPAEGEVVFDHA